MAGVSFWTALRAFSKVAGDICVLDNDGVLIAIVSADDDLDHMSRWQLMADVRKLRAGIREDRELRSTSSAAISRRFGGSFRRRPDPVPVLPVWPEFFRAAYDTD